MNNFILHTRFYQVMLNMLNLNGKQEWMIKRMKTEQGSSNNRTSQIYIVMITKQYSFIITILDMTWKQLAQSIIMFLRFYTMSKATAHINNSNEYDR